MQAVFARRTAHIWNHPVRTMPCVFQCFERANSLEQKDTETARARLRRVLEAERQGNKMSSRRSVESEYRVEGSVLDELGLDQQAAVELRLKAALHQKILQLMKRKSEVKIKVKGVGQECPTHTSVKIGEPVAICIGLSIINRPSRIHPF